MREAYLFLPLFPKKHFCKVSCGWNQHTLLQLTCMVSCFYCLSYEQSTANKSQLAHVGGSLGLIPVLQGLEEKGRQLTGRAMEDERCGLMLSALQHLLNVL